MEEKAVEGPGAFRCWQQEVGGWGRDIASTSVECPVLHDEIRGDPVAAKIAGPLRVVHSDRKILMDLKMEVRGIHPVVIANCADLLPSRHLLALVHHDPVKMTVERVGEVNLAILDPSVPDHHHVTPVRADIACQNDQSVPNRMHRMTE